LYSQYTGKKGISSRGFYFPPEKPGARSNPIEICTFTVEEEGIKLKRKIIILFV
jgi:hypothetical protein